MKTAPKFFICLCSILAFLSLTSLHAPEMRDYHIKGVYKTLDDYNKGNLCTDYDALLFRAPKYKLFFAEKGEDVKTRSGVNYVDENTKGEDFEASTFYGYVDADGLTWRLEERKFPKEKECYCILQSGKICLYATNKVTLKKDSKGKIIGMDCPSSTRDFYYNDEGKENVKPLTTEFFFNFYVSSGPDAQLFCCEEKNLETLMADDPAVVAKIKDKGIYQLRFNKWNESFNDVMAWVSEYNSSHK